MPDELEMKLFCFGLGYTAKHLTFQLGDKLESVVGTCRSVEKIKDLKRKNIAASLLEDVNKDDILNATHILISIPPDDIGDVVLADFLDIIKQHKNLSWLAYLSTTGVYGDHQGEWVDEETPPTPNSARSKRRLNVEEAWLEAHRTHQVPTHIFRLSAIYGPYRNLFSDIHAGRIKSIHKPGQYFSRTHVDDIAGILAHSMQSPTPGEVYNICDDLPSSTMEVQQHVASLLHVAPPPVIAYEDAALSVMQREFYATNRRVKNDKVKSRLAYNLLYPTYKEGLTAIFEQKQYNL